MNDKQAMGWNKGVWWIAGIVAAMLTVGALFIGWAAQRADREMREDLLQQARLVAQAVNIDYVKMLTGTEADLDNPHYLRLKAQLAAVKHANDQYRFVYLVGRKDDGALFFRVDNEPPDSRDYSPPGQIYDEAPESFQQVFAARTATVEGPYTDRWGAWVSALVPITDPATDTVIAVMGMDIDAHAWQWEVAARSALPVGLSLTLLISVIVAFIATRRIDAAPKPILRRLMAPLIATLLMLVAGFGAAIVAEQKDRLNESSRLILKDVSDNLDQILAEQ